MLPVHLSTTTLTTYTTSMKTFEDPEQAAAVAQAASAGLALENAATNQHNMQQITLAAFAVCEQQVLKAAGK